MKAFISFAAGLLISMQAFGQDLLGYGHSNYAGISGASYNPASLADSRFSMDIQVFGFGVEVANNYVGVKRIDMYRSDFDVNYLHLRTRDTKKSVFFRNEVLLPGIMFSNEKFGWGVDMKVRTYANVDGVENELAHIFLMELKDVPQYNQALFNRHIGIQALSWMEIGGTYAQTIWTGAEHFVAVGARPKFLLGLGAAYAFVNDAGYSFRDDTTLNLVRGDVEFGHSNNFAFDAAFNPSYRIGFNPGIGVDFGIVYEFRPDAMQDQKTEKKEKPWPGYRERPKYKYRIGASVTDLGFVHFRHGEFSDHYTVNANMWDYDDDAFDLSSPNSLYNTFELRQGGSKEGKGFFMRLPLALNLQYDYYWKYNIYVNATSFTGIYLRNWDGKRVHELTRLSITPRWEKRWFAVWAPVSFTRMGVVSLGAGFRLGPLAIGTTDILNLALRRKTMYNADIYFVLKVPLFPTKKGKAKKGKTNTGGPVDECPD
jgi:hypothetical protein